MCACVSEHSILSVFNLNSEFCMNQLLHLFPASVATTLTFLLSEATCLKHFIRISNGLKESDLPITPLLLQHGYCSSFPFKTHMPTAASY